MKFHVVGEINNLLAVSPRLNIVRLVMTLVCVSDIADVLSHVLINLPPHRRLVTTDNSNNAQCNHLSYNAEGQLADVRHVCHSISHQLHCHIREITFVNDS